MEGFEPAFRRGGVLKIASFEGEIGYLGKDQDQPPKSRIRTLEFVDCARKPWLEQTPYGSMGRGRIFTDWFIMKIQKEINIPYISAMGKTIQ